MSADAAATPDCNGSEPVAAIPRTDSPPAHTRTYVFTDTGSTESEKAQAAVEALPESRDGQSAVISRSRLRGALGHLLELVQRPDPRNKPKNPLRLLTLTPRQAFTFAVACMGWMVDSLDFFCVTMTTTELADAFGKEPSSITTAITVTLMLRPVGALLFGLAADRYGRRVPLIVNLTLFTVIELASGFAQNLGTFIGLRAIYGILMGGEWGLGNSLAMEVLPAESRGLFSGILQVSYSLGSLVAAMLYYAVVPHLGWRALFWISIIPAAITIAMSLFLKESEAWRQTRRAQQDGAQRYGRVAADMLRQHWVRCIYAVVLMAAMNFLSHGSQDLYPTFLKEQHGFSPRQATIGTVVGNVGAIIGGIFFGYISEYLGRRRTIAICAICGACFVPLWILPSAFGALLTGAFFMQIFVQGAWGVIPAFLSEISPAAFRATFPGLSYQLGNLISASASQIEATLGEKNPLPELRNGKTVPDYGRVQGILIGIIFACVLVLAVIGREEKGKRFETGAKSDNDASV
ncbi:Carboxylic acid transporter [Coemansia biformis]|uniref:Carboxylic acid transporter n=1 Tax=Coemansia biformis TaxID=1286918 RepID=A0A9W7YD78_9FUNG|nr:Carboxylic acid transporter [Coemansia biformis]